MMRNRKDRGAAPPADRESEVPLGINPGSLKLIRSTLTPAGSRSESTRAERKLLAESFTIHLLSAKLLIQ